MKEENFQTEHLDEIVKNTIISLEKDKKQIFEIAESARHEWQVLEEKLIHLKKTVQETIREVDQLEAFEKESRQRLMLVSKNFKFYTEDDIKKAYETTKNLQIKLAISREKERQFIAQRSELEIRIRSMRTTLERAEYLVSHVAVAMNYLGNSLMNISNVLMEMQNKELLGINIIMAQEEERQRLARDIHDGPAQSLSNIMLKCEICEKLIEVDARKAKQEIRELKKLVRLSLQELRDIIFDLRPMSLDDLGLLPTLQGYIAKFVQETGIKIDLEIYEQDIKLASVIEVAVFRIIQESLNNLKKHSHASQASIHLKINNGVLLGTIKDNGVGFDIDRLQKNNLGDEKTRGFGIYGMRQRAELLKGKLKMESQLGQGTTLILEIPIEIPEKEENSFAKDQSIDCG